MPYWLIVFIYALIIPITNVGIAAAASPPVAASGRCLEFDGMDDYVYTTLHNSLDDATIEVWVYSDGGGGIIDNGGAGSGSAEGQIYATSDSLFAYRWWGNGGGASCALPLGAWHHVAVVYTFTAIYLYLDGELVDSATGLSNPKLASDNYNWCIGATRSGTQNWFGGRLDEVRIWSTVRTQQQIRDDMYRTIASNETGLEAYYRFDEGSGTTAGDPVANADGTLTNMAAGSWNTASAWMNPAVPEDDTLTFSAGYDDDTDSVTVVVIDAPASGVLAADMSTALLSYVPGADFFGSDTFSYYVYPEDGGADTAVIAVTVTPVNDAPVTRGGRCLDFDGVDDYVLVDGLTDLGGDEICIEYWFRGSYLMYPVSQFKSPNYIIAGHYNRHSFYGSSSGGYVDDNNGTTSRDGNWHHVAWSWKRNTTDGFLTMFDGRVISRLNSYDRSIPNVDTPLLLGSREAGASPYNTEGCLDEVRIWNTARTEEQIKRYRYCEVDPSDTTLVAWYRFEEMGDTVLPDMSDNGRTGALGNMDDADWVSSGYTDSLSLLENDTLVISAGYDPDGDSTTISLKNGAAYGILALDHARTEITYMPDSLFEGIDSFSYYLTDTEGGVDSAFCRVEVISINAEPYFTAGGNDTVAEDCGPVTDAAWATGINAGNGYEDWQTLTFHVSAENGILFSVQPVVDPVTGDLTYTPADDAYGESRVFVYLTDNGGTLYGGADTSPVDTFMIVVNSAGNDDPPVAEASGYVLDLDGSDDYVLSSYYDTLAEMTVECWVWADGNGVIVDNGGYGGGAAEAYLALSSGTLSAVRGSSAGTASGALGTGAWHHVAAVFTASEIILYIDGETADSVTGLGCPDLASTNYAWCVGALRGGTSSRFNGRLDELRVWDGVRTKTQLRRHRYQPAEADTAGLMLWYRFDHTVGTDVHDASGNGRDGVLHNAAFDVWTARGGVEVFEDETLSVSAGFNLEDDGFSIAELAGPSRGAVSYDGGRGVITYIPDADWFGTDSIGYVVTDTTGRADTTLMHVDVIAVNDIPSFVCGGNDTVDEDCGPVTVPGWAAPVDKGNEAESLQTLSFYITVERPHLFSVQPAIDTETGDLTYTPAPYLNGTTAVQVYLRDNGGTVYDGADQTDTDTFTITINNLDDDAPVAGPYAGNALDFDYSNDFVSAVPQVPGAYEPYTMESWVYVDQGGCILSWSEDSYRYKLLYASSAGIYNLWTGASFYVSTGTSIRDAWHHIAATYDGTTRRIYLDGVLLGSDVPGTGSYPDGGTLHIGSRNGTGYFFGGLLDEVRVWNTARSAEDIVSHMYGPLTGDESGLVAYYRFDQREGYALPDGSTGGNDGTLYNMTGQEWTGSDAWSIPAACEDIPAILSSGYDPDGDGITGSEITAPAHGSISFDDADGTITYQPDADYNGTDIFSFAVTDPDGNADTAVITISVNAVNDAPVFTIGGNDTVAGGAGPQTVSGWATGISAGAADETTQVLTFMLSSDKEGLFAVAPAVDPVTGDLTYTSVGYAGGTATVYVYLQDDGGVDYGGCDTSAVDSFTIVVVRPDTNIAPVAGSGTALAFNGTDEYVLTMLDAQPSAHAEMTWEAWIKPGRINHTGYQGILCTDDGGWDRGLWITSGADNFSVGYGAQWIPPYTVDTTGWHHVAVVYLANDVRFYYDGAVWALGHKPYGGATAYDLKIGIGTDVSQFYQGQIDEIRIWNTVRTTDEIQANMYAPLAGDEPGLLAYWRMDAASGSLLVDATSSIVPAPLANMDSTNRVSSGPWEFPSVNEDDTLSIVCGYDPDGDSITGFGISAPSHGTTGYDTAAATVTYLPDPDYSGIDSFSYRVADPDGLADTAEIIITVHPVNDVPVFTAGGNDTVTAGRGERTIAGWASGMYAGAVDETTQVLAFVVSTDKAGLFEAGPAVDAATGDMTYTPASHMGGTAAVYVSLQDDGGTAYGGSDVSTVDSIVIVIRPGGIAAPVAGAGGALEFNGTDEYVVTTVYDTLNEATVECWVYADSGGGFIDNGGAGGGSAEIQMYVSGDSLHADRWWGNGGGTSAPVTIGEWHHAAAVFTSSEIRLYLDGALVDSAVGLSNPDVRSVDYNWCIGSLRGGTSTPFAGRIDEVRIWSTVRTPDEIRVNAYRPLTGMESGLEAYYRCDALDDRLVDATGHHTAALFTAVDSSNRIPSGAWARRTVDEDDTLTVAVGYDIDGDSLSAGILDAAAHGALTVDGTALAVSYLPAADWWGTDSFSYYVADTQAADTYAVTVSVSPVADPVTITSTVADTAEELIPYAYTVTVDDADGDAVITMPAGPGWLSFAGTGATGIAPVGSNGDTVMTFIAANAEYADTLTVALAVRDSGGAVPVELTSFTAELQGRVVVLNWTTATESCNFGFNVLRGTTPAGPFTQVNAALVPGAGTTSLPQTYRFEDPDNAAGAGYYRLEQVDTYGRTAFSDAVGVSGVSGMAGSVSGRPYAYRQGGWCDLRGTAVRSVGGRVPGIYLYKAGNGVVKEVVTP